MWGNARAGVPYNKIVNYASKNKWEDTASGSTEMRSRRLHDVVLRKHFTAAAVTKNSDRLLRVNGLLTFIHVEDGNFIASMVCEHHPH